jgi:hypothetical protein
MLSKIRQGLILAIVALIFFSSLSNHVQSTKDYIKIDIDNLPFKQEIKVPFDTSQEIAKYQPVDIRIEFNQPCWAKDETKYSVRVGVDDGKGITEIESQIYDLEHSDESHIKACSLVFLIPEKANGKEKYYVLYDSKETSPPGYPNHLKVEDTHYYYEPIPGQKIDFDYYGIRDEGFVVYAVIQKGELLGHPIALAVVKFKPGSTAVETYNLDQLGDFDFRYGIPGEPDYTGSSWANDITKAVLVAGNLMVRVRLGCVSPRGDIKSDNIYTYYYSPTEVKRISVDAHHEILKTINIDDPSILDGVCAGITSIKSRSASIQKMNVGEILPMLYLYDEDNTIQKFSVPSNPESVKPEVVLSTEDNADLGRKGWVCIGDPASGKVHGLIFSSNTGLVDGPNDGFQIKVYAKQNIKLPGLEADTGNLYVTRNAYENGKQNAVLNKGETYHYKVEFLTAEKGGYERIDQESNLYQSLIKGVPARVNATTSEVKKERYTLITYVHFARSFPLGSLLSAALGKNVSYIYAELYQGENFRSSGSVGRLSLRAISLDMTGKNLREKIKTILGIFDWKNTSFFKKIRFPDLDPGRYIVKIFRENPRFAKERQYIGFGIVDLEKNTAIHVACRPQGSIKISIFDQGKKGVEDIQCLLQLGNATIADTVSDSNGSAILYAPCFPLKPYHLKMLYKGFSIVEKKVNLKLRNQFVDLKESFSIERYAMRLKVKDTWGFPTVVDVNPTLTSKDMVVSTIIRGESNEAGEYVFTNLISAPYTLDLSYKSFKVEENLDIEKEKTLDIVFPAEFTLDFNVFNSYSNVLSSGDISLQRNGKIVSTSIEENGTASFRIPPGDYEILVHADNEDIAKQKIEVRGEKEVDIVTSKDSLFHTVVMYFGLAIVIGTILFMIWKKNLYAGLKLLAIGLLVIALVSPWWVLSGEKGGVSTLTKTLLVPPRIVTITESSIAIGGEISSVPEQVTMVLGLLSVLVAVACLFIFFSVSTKMKLRKTTIMLSILSIVVLIITLIIFYYAFSQLTGVGVGSFIGSGNLDVTIPGEAQATVLPCGWGPGLGFYLLIIAFILLILTSFSKKIEERISRK